jgi:hypothetical protein
MIILLACSSFLAVRYSSTGARRQRQRGVGKRPTDLQSSQSSNGIILTIMTIKWNTNVNLMKMRLMLQKVLAIQIRSSAAWSVLTTIGTSQWEILLVKGSITRGAIMIVTRLSIWLIVGNTAARLGTKVTLLPDLSLCPLSPFCCLGYPPNPTPSHNTNTNTNKCRFFFYPIISL